MKNDPRSILNYDYFIMLTESCRRNLSISELLFLGNHKNYDLYTWKVGGIRHFGAKNLASDPHMTFAHTLRTGDTALGWLKEAIYRFQEQLTT